MVELCGGERAVVTTLAGGVSGTTGVFANGAGTNAGFNGPCGVAVDASGNVFVGDRDNHRVRMVTPAGGTWALSRSLCACCACMHVGSLGTNEPWCLASILSLSLS
jgi:hypothetical protein